MLLFRGTNFSVRSSKESYCACLLTVFCLWGRATGVSIIPVTHYVRYNVPGYRTGRLDTRTRTINNLCRLHHQPSRQISRSTNNMAWPFNNTNVPGGILQSVSVQRYDRDGEREAEGDIDGLSVLSSGFKSLISVQSTHESKRKSSFMDGLVPFCSLRYLSATTSSWIVVVQDLSRNLKRQHGFPLVSMIYDIVVAAGIAVSGVDIKTTTGAWM